MLAQTPQEMLDGVRNEALVGRRYQAMCLTPQGWHVMWGMNGLLRSSNREELVEIGRVYSADQGQIVAIVELVPHIVDIISPTKDAG